MSDDPIDQDLSKLPDPVKEPEKVRELEISLDKQLKCGLTRREIAQMKKAGMEKPSFVPWPEWLGPKKLSARQMFICYLAAMGRTAREISEEIGMTDARLSLLLNSEALKEQIQLIRDVEFAGLGIQQQIDQLAPQALRVAERMLKSDNVPDSLKWRIADKVIDRKLGRIPQQINIGGTLLTDVYRLMQESNKVMENRDSKVIDLMPDKAANAELDGLNIDLEANKDFQDWLKKAGY
jgi:hypothetical protein